jgi:ribosome-binding factor A
MPKPHQQGNEPSHRTLRVGELVRHTVSDLLTRGVINDPALAGQVVTVPSVRMSPDLKLATVYVMPLGGKDVAAVVAALDRNKKFLRTEIARSVNLKFAPEVRFKADQSFEASAKIDALFEKPEVKRDLARQDHDGQDHDCADEESHHEDKKDEAE